MVRRKHFIGMMLMGLLAVAACTSIKAPEPVEGPSPELCAIDSLMWHQPDSALAVLLEYDGNTDGFNGHYAQLLASELLYKNDYEQTNRPELQRAVGYFDSLLMMADTRHASTKTTAFLAARAHYINGVGYYERDSVVEACKEYLKTLDLMERWFEEKTLTGKRAQFMAYSFNRLGKLFSEQFMMDPSIACYETALAYCKIEPTSSHGVSNTLFQIGKQYDKKNETNKAKSYFEQAIEGMKDSDNLLYRDIISSKAVCEYQLGIGLEKIMDDLRPVVAHAGNEEELINRYLTVGALFYEEGIYDSALYYLIPVFENTENRLSQIQAAEYLRNVYDSIGELGKADVCARFLADQKKSEGQNKALVSQLEDLFQNHMKQKQEQKALQEKKEAVSKTVKIVVPVIVFVCVCIIFIIKRRNIGRMKTELLTHRMEKAALSGRLKQSNREVRELKDQIRQQTKTEPASSFTEEPICRLIMERVNEGQFKSKVDCAIYKQYALDKQHLLDLRVAADRHFNQFTLRLKKVYPELTNIDIDYCCLYLLNLTHSDVSALMQRAYNTVVERDSKMRKIFGSKEPLSIILKDIAQKPSSI